MGRVVRNVQLIFDRDHGKENEGWHTRHDEYTDAGDLLNAGCDNGLDCTDPDNAEAALDEAVANFGRGVRRESIEVIA